MIYSGFATQYSMHLFLVQYKHIKEITANYVTCIHIFFTVTCLEAWSSVKVITSKNGNLIVNADTTLIIIALPDDAIILCYKECWRAGLV